VMAPPHPGSLLFPPLARAPADNLVSGRFLYTPLFFTKHSFQQL